MSKTTTLTCLFVDVLRANGIVTSDAQSDLAAAARPHNTEMSCNESKKRTASSTTVKKEDRNNEDDEVSNAAKIMALEVFPHLFHVCIPHTNLKFTCTSGRNSAQTRRAANFADEGRKGGEDQSSASEY